MAYPKNRLEDKPLSRIIEGIPTGKNRLIAAVTERDKNCRQDHDSYFVDFLEKFSSSIYGKLDSKNKYDLEESIESLEFIYNLKELKSRYKFGNLPEKGEEDRISKLYSVISNNYDKLTRKDMDLAVEVIHYLNSSSKWEKVNYMHYFNS
jgi:hypothetical protein